MSQKEGAFKPIPSTPTCAKSFGGCLLSWALGYPINAPDRFDISVAARSMNQNLKLPTTIGGLAANTFFWRYLRFQLPASTIMATTMVIWAPVPPVPPASRYGLAARHRGPRLLDGVARYVTSLIRRAMPVT
jgi:hypothetical protein